LGGDQKQVDQEMGHLFHEESRVRTNPSHSDAFRGAFPNEVMTLSGPQDQAKGAYSFLSGLPYLGYSEGS